MNDQENIRLINLRNKLSEKKEEIIVPFQKPSEKTPEQLHKEHLERLAALHRGTRKW